MTQEATDHDEVATLNHCGSFLSSNEFILHAVFLLF
jgi:hypothetical protein